MAVREINQVQENGDHFTVIWESSCELNEMEDMFMGCGVSII